MKEWTKERCSEEPQELQLVADGIYIQRKNIKKVQPSVASCCTFLMFFLWM